MKLGIIVYCNDPETVYNAFRFANLALSGGDQVRVFLLGKGVESETLDTDSFKVNEQVQAFVGGSGRIFACGACLKIRQQGGSAACPVSTLKDMYEIVKESDRIVTF